MKSPTMLFFGALLLVSCQSTPASSTLDVKPVSVTLSGIDTDHERETTLRILDKMVRIRGGGDYLTVKDVQLIVDQTIAINNSNQFKVVPAHYTLLVKKDFFKRASDISDMANLTRPPFFSKLDQAQLSQRADAAVVYKKNQEVRLDWKLVFQKNADGDYKRIFPNPENESELMTPEAYEKLLDEHLPEKK